MALDVDLTPLDSQTFIQGIFANHPQLQLLWLQDTDFDSFKCICDGIEKGLYLNKNKGIKRENLKIFICFGDDELMTPKSSDAFIKSRIF